MNKEKLIKEYNRVTKEQEDLSAKILELMTELYEKRISDSQTVEELDEIQNEIFKEWPNTVGSLLMYKNVKQRRSEIALKQIGDLDE